jgi:hypothetical protein
MSRTEEDRLMTTAEARAYLSRRGYNVQEQTLRFHVRRGKLTPEVYGSGRGSVWMFPQAELDRFLAEDRPKLRVGRPPNYLKQ